MADTRKTTTAAVSDDDLVMILVTILLAVLYGPEDYDDFELERNFRSRVRAMRRETERRLVYFVRQALALTAHATTDEERQVSLDALRGAAEREFEEALLTMGWRAKEGTR